MPGIASVRQVVSSTTNRRFHSRLRIVSMPKSFQQALNRGWKVQSERTTLGADRRHRWGKLILAMAGQPRRISVDYTASAKAGYEFSKPQLI